VEKQLLKEAEEKAAADDVDEEKIDGETRIVVDEDGTLRKINHDPPLPENDAGT
jgi:hypothetical protein